jgi:hypothetical protein
MFNQDVRLRGSFFFWPRTRQMLRRRPNSNSPLSCFSVFPKNRSDVVFQGRFHALFGLLEITSPHQNGQVSTNALPTLPPAQNTHSTAMGLTSDIFRVQDGMTFPSVIGKLVLQASCHCLARLSHFVSPFPQYGFCPSDFPCSANLLTLILG